VSESDKLARIFKLLSVETRVRMITLLRHRAMCVNAIARELEITSAAVSQHLRLLREAEIVVANRHGYFVHYRVNEKTMAEWNSTLQGLLGVHEPRGASPFKIVNTSCE